MSPLLMSVIVFACVSGGAFLGMFLRNRLPEQHLSGATKDAVRLGSGLIGTIADVLAARSVPFVFSTGYDKDTLLDGYDLSGVAEAFSPVAIERRARETVDAKGAKRRI